MLKTYIIAEAGVNHNGKLDLALNLIDAAVAAKANAVKFQTFNTELLVTPNTPKADYQCNIDEDNTQASMLKKLELSHADFHTLYHYCQDKNIDFLSTPFDLPSLYFLVTNLDLPTIKFGSGELTNSLLLLQAARLQKKIILSTGMASLGEIEQALGVLAFGYLNEPMIKPCMDNFMKAFYSDKGQQWLQEKVSLLHCITDYPAQDDAIHLQFIQTLKYAFGLPIGYSDHSLGINIPIAAVALGAQIIEKHLTLDKTMPGPDHKASLDPQEFRNMVIGIRQVEKALGSSRKTLSQIELKNRNVARKSLVANSPISKGTPFQESNLSTKRPETGISALYYWDYVGKTAEKNYNENELIE